MEVPNIELNNGLHIPAIGSGLGIIGYSARAKNGFGGRIADLINKVHRRFVTTPKYINMVAHSLNIGYTLLDNSAAYNNLSEIGRAIKRSNKSREDILLTTRVSNKAQAEGRVREEFLDGLKQLNTNYVDLLQFHWPVTGHYLDTWREMEQLYREGYCRAIGVANCHVHHLEAISHISDITPAVNQVEVHPLFTQKPLVEYCQSRGIVVQAYSPLSRFDDRLFRLPLLKNIAKKHNRSLVQIVLRWHIQNGVIPIVKSLNKGRQRQNISIFDFELSAEEMRDIDGVNINSRIRYDPDNCDFTIL